MLKARMFFYPSAVNRFIEAKIRIRLGTQDPTRSDFENATRVNRQPLLQRFVQLVTHHLEHTVIPLYKSVLIETKQEFPDELTQTQESVF